MSALVQHYNSKALYAALAIYSIILLAGFRLIDVLSLDIWWSRFATLSLVLFTIISQCTNIYFMNQHFWETYYVTVCEEDFWLVIAELRDFPTILVGSIFWSGYFNLCEAAAMAIIGIILVEIYSEYILEKLQRERQINLIHLNSH